MNGIAKGHFIKKRVKKCITECMKMGEKKYSVLTGLIPALSVLSTVSCLYKQVKAGACSKAASPGEPGTKPCSPRQTGHNS